MTNFIDVLVLTAVFFYQIDIVFMQSQNAVHFGKRFNVDSFTTLYEITHNQCYNACLRRSACKSYNYWTSAHLCDINKVDPRDQLVAGDSVLCSAKRDWQQQEYDQRCEVCDDRTVCTVDNSGHVSCDIEECSSDPQTIENTIILGNKREIGSKRKYVCKGDLRKVGDTDASVCQATGTWSQATIQCVHNGCWSTGPLEHTNLIITDVTYMYQSGLITAHVECKPDFLFRGYSKQIECNKTQGTYDFSLICCDKPEEPGWTLIFRFHSGRSGILKFYTNTDEKLAYRRDCMFQHTNLIQTWDTSMFRHIKVEIIHDGDVVAWLTFSSENTSKSNWFSRENLLHSSWTDIPTNGTYIFQWKKAYNTSRSQISLRFPVLLTTNPTTCDDFHGWLVVLQHNFAANNCGWERVFTGRVVYYAPNNVIAQSLQNFKVADTLQISVDQVT